MSVDTLNVAITALIIAAFVGVLAMRFAYRRRVVEVEREKPMGSYGEVEVELASSRGGRRFVVLGYEVTDTRTHAVREIEVLLGSAGARQLAEMLEVAAAPGRTLAEARAAARRGQRVASAPLRNIRR